MTIQTDLVVDTHCSVDYMNLHVKLKMMTLTDEVEATSDVIGVSRSVTSMSAGADEVVASAG